MRVGMSHSLPHWYVVKPKRSFEARAAIAVNCPEARAAAVAPPRKRRRERSGCMRQSSCRNQLSRYERSRQNVNRSANCKIRGELADKICPTVAVPIFATGFPKFGLFNVLK